MMSVMTKMQAEIRVLKQSRLFATDWRIANFFRSTPDKRHSDRDVGFRAV
jgi:hypothetical protein